MLRRNSGITLMVLVITIIILLILAGTATFTGISAVENSRITTFRTEMEMIRIQLNSPTEVEKYVKTESNTLTEEQKSFLNKVQILLDEDNLSIALDTDGFKYFTKEEIKNISNIEISRDLYINANTKTIVSSEGVKYNGKTYYMLEQLPDSLYNVEENIQNSGDVTFEVTADELNITISNIEYNATYVNKGTIQYKLSTEENWTTVAKNSTSRNFTFEVSVSGEYNIRVIDAKNNEGISNITIENTLLVADGSWDEEKKVNTPNLEGTGLIGIYWDEEGNEIEVTAENQDNWYDYSNQKWANAITKDEEGNITGYWVWIPRYAYKITSNLGTSTAGEIEVKFLQGTSNYDENKSTISQEYPTVTNNAMQDYVVHPAFTDNINNGGWDSEISGFWVAKYAAGYQECTQTVNTDGTITEPTTDTAKVQYSNKTYTSYNTSSYPTNALSQTLTSDNYTNEKIPYPVFKPLTYAYNAISIGDIFTISREIENATSFYGLSNVDSHLEKNSEWGAVAYLTQSSYGRDGTEVTINSKNLSNLNSLYIYAVTGYAKSTANGVQASSTGNMSGVFDLNGCVWEINAGFISNGDRYLATYGASLLDNTGVTYNGTTVEAGTGNSTKYATIYPYNSSSQSRANNYTAYKDSQTSTYGYGDAILETSTAGSGSTSWNGYYSDYPSTGAPFFRQGLPYNGTGGGSVFSFESISGNMLSNCGFRVVLIS